MTRAQTNPELRGAGGSGWVRCLAARAVVCALIPAGMAGPAFGLEPTTTLAEFGRQAWGMENGLPQNSVHAVVQTKDGFLWAATEAGLVRFDGNSFLLLDQNSRPALPSGDIRCLLATSDGVLWVGTSDGLARLKGGVVTTFTKKDGLPGSNIRALTQEDQFIHVVTESGEAGIEGDQIKPLIDARLVSPDARDQTIFHARLADGRTARATTTTVEVFGNGKSLQLRTDKDLLGTKIQALVADHAGALWIGTNGGLVRYVNGRLDRFPITDTLATASILSVTEDHEGDLWVGTEASGLHILRDQRFRNIGAHEGLSSDATTALVEDTQKRLWVGTNGAGLNVVRLGNLPMGLARIYPVRDVLLSDIILSLAASPQGDVWVGTPDGLNRIRGSAVDAFTSADGLPDDFVRSLLVDTDGSLWIGTRRGLAHWAFGSGSRRPTRKMTYTESNGLGSNLVGAMARDSHGDLWIATLAGLSRLHNGKIVNFTKADGLPSDVVTALLAEGGGVLLAGTQDHGWARWDGSKFSSVANERLAETSIRAILDDGGKHLWLATENGIARCDSTATVDCTNWVEFGTADGLRSRETATNSHPSAFRSHDGHLWFATPKGLVEIDPAHFLVNAIPPQVAVERFAVDDVDQVLRTGNDPVVVPAGHNHFELDYAGLSFIAPQKVRYRYMLEGFDKAWTEAGTRRVAYYTNIPPGHYTFRVQAANNDGVWNLQGTSLQFELKPHFYQTVWFYVLLALTGAALIALALRRRLLLAEREFKAVLGERNRIAREIHDTLAQGYVGISVQLEVLAELLRHNKPEAAQKQLNVTRNHVREGLAEARQSIWALRSQDSDEKTLPVILRRTTEQADGHGLEASFSVFGAYRPLSPGTEREILRVAQEALHNVKKHAGARSVTVRLDYGPAEISLEVRDDGKGFEAESTPEPSPGHYGLTGMKERAAAIHGSLEITSEQGTGTVVRLRAPAPQEAKE